MTWKELLKQVLGDLGGEADLPEIYSRIEGYEKTLTNPTWQATIRRTIRQYNIFEPIGAERSGKYRLVEEPNLEYEEGYANSKDEKYNHGIIQGMLLSLGKIMGYETFCPKTDQTVREFQEIPLSQLVTVRDLAESFSKNQHAKMREVDVIWLKEDNAGLYPRYAFEVEHTTRVKSGLERLIEIPERYNTLLYVIVPSQTEISLFDKYMDREVFRGYKPRFTIKDYQIVENSYNAAVNYTKAINEMEVGR